MPIPTPCGIVWRRLADQMEPPSNWWRKVRLWLTTSSAPRRPLCVLRSQQSPSAEAAASPVQTNLEPYLTLRETAKRLGMSTATLWRWKIPGHELGGRPRFRVSEVEAYLQSEEFKRRVAALRAIRKGRLRRETGDSE